MAEEFKATTKISPEKGLILNRKPFLQDSSLGLGGIYSISKKKLRFFVFFGIEIPLLRFEPIPPGSRMEQLAVFIEKMAQELLF